MLGVALVVSWHNLICVDKGSIPTTLAALANHYTLVKEPRQSLASLNSFALTDQKPRIPTLTYRTLFPLPASMFTCEAKDTLLPPAFRAPSPDHAFEVAFLGPRVIFDGQCERNHATRRAAYRSERVVIVWIAISGYTFFGERLQVGESVCILHLHQPSMVSVHLPHPAMVQGYRTPKTVA
jgi:hypothetical protein